ncbi:MAG: 2-amino-4-hydroxy-6-hydroxymethyldihydropteridine diphosphokinase [Elusimicrobia bacterium]|nr:2-amino-4-hydroxy-6-hydroxymethyldihydropteridine diphosphokinase [Elusimicrobiota bacterium]
MSADALLLLGGNLGDRAATLRRAVAAIRRWDGVRVTRVSRVFETAPVGPSDRPYLNQAVRVRATRTPMGLLLEAKTLEAACGRRVAARWTSRPLDVDLVAHGRTRLRTPWLTVPHPGMPSRAFALAPLADVAPDRRLDGRRTVRAALSALAPDAATARPWRGRSAAK